MANRIENDTTLEYLSDRFGNALEGLGAEGASALARLRGLLPEGEFCFVTKNVRTGAYGFVIEGSEYPYDGTRDLVDPDWYEGKTINGTLMAADDFPSLADILAHSEVEADAVNAQFPGLDAAIHYGSSTFDGHVTILAFVGEGTQHFASVKDIGEALHMAREANTPTTARVRL